MERTDLLKSREYWMADIQLKLFSIIESYQKEHGLNRTQIAEKLGVTKGYVSQVLNGDYDHKISKLVDLSLAFNKVPLLYFEDLDLHLARDAEDKAYELIPVMRSRPITYRPKTPEPISFTESSTRNGQPFVASFPQVR